MFDANFTAGGLLLFEFRALEELVNTHDWEVLVQKEIVENNLVAIKTEGARKRILLEIKRRVLSAPGGFFEFLYQLNEKEQRLALLFLCLKTYPLVFEIHWELAVKKYKTGGDVDAYNVTMRLDEIASKNEEVATWSDKTLTKINSQYRKVLKDAGILKNKKLIQPDVTNKRFWNYFTEINEAWFLEACFINN